jgi:hypothetical protein
MSVFHRCDKCSATIDGEPWTVDISSGASTHFRRIEVCKTCKDKICKGTPTRFIVKPLRAVFEGVILKGTT